MLFAPASCGAVACLDCHANAGEGIAAGHRFVARPCARCHGGNESAYDLEHAHEGLIAFPGDLSNAVRVCGGCHKEQVEGVIASDMHTGAGMVAATRETLGSGAHTPAAPTLQHLGEGVADSLLRKLCASCHLGQPKEDHRLDPVIDRGGGCLACHINTYSETSHPMLSARVEDGRCFGCHSRSGRISLNYAGLAEVETTPAVSGDSAARLARLPDGRLVERRTPDSHHSAGLACVDCHTGAGIMGLAAVPSRKNTDIACDDCHDNRRPRATPRQWPAAQRASLGRVPFDAAPDQPFLATASGTALWHIELRAGRALLYPKLGGDPVPIPQVDVSHQPLAEQHRSLSCDACHATWAPQCYGCHLSYDAAGEQWDHAAGQITRGAWREHRWDIRNAPPPLGRHADGTVDTFVPGMIMTVAHPDWREPRFVRRFAPLSPHTTGRARTCAGCHSSPTALGLGEGRISLSDAGWRFAPLSAPLADGLPADAWTALELIAPASSDGDRPRPFPRNDIERLLEALAGRHRAPSPGN